MYGNREDIQAITFHLLVACNSGSSLHGPIQENVVQQVRNLAACDIIKTVSPPKSGSAQSR